MNKDKKEDEIAIEFTYPLNVTKDLMEKGQWKSDDGKETITMENKFSKSEKKFVLGLIQEAEKLQEKEKELRIEKTKKIAEELREASHKILIENSIDGKNVEIDIFLTALSSCFIQWGLDLYSEDKRDFIRVLKSLPDKVKQSYNL